MDDLSNESSETQAAPTDWAERIRTTPRGRIRLNTFRGEVEYGTGSLTPGQIATIQGYQIEYGDTIEWVSHADETLKDGRPGPFTLAWTDKTDGRVHAATWDAEGRPNAHGTSR